MKIILNAALVVSFCFLACQPGLTQDQASSVPLTVTLTSLKGKIESPLRYYSMNGERFSYLLRDVSFDGCTMSFYKESVGLSPGEGYLFGKQKTRIVLSEFDPVSVRALADEPSSPPRWKVEAFTTYNKKVKVGKDIYCNLDGSGCGREMIVESDKISFSVFDAELAKRTATALQYAIKLCGGKIDPF